VELEKERAATGVAAKRTQAEQARVLDARQQAKFLHACK
jgi:hypothetical protein